jgi:beta-phosphoglucomutase-like phosphatase (HAD superfamily)
MTRASLQEIIASTRHLLLDFDGPVCAVFAGTPAPVVAKQLRGSLTAAGFTLPGEAQDQDDPLEVFRAVARASDDAAVLAQHVLTALEVRAVKTAQPTPGSADLIATADRTGRTVTIVSNNSGAAISAYLADHRLTGYVRAVVARDDHDQDRMKPSPYRVREAVGMLGAEPVGAECAFIGDSPSDVLAGHLVGVPVIGYASNPAKVRALAEAQAATVTTSLAEITTALRAAPITALPN